MPSIMVAHPVNFEETTRTDPHTETYTHRIALYSIDFVGQPHVFWCSNKWSEFTIPWIHGAQTLFWVTQSKQQSKSGVFAT